MVHQAPLGFVVAAPALKWTGSKLIAFVLAVAVGLTQMLGGLIAYGILQSGDVEDEVYGTLFGMAGGVMAYIGFKELLPAARRIDTNDKQTTAWFFFGMLIMAATLVAVRASGGHSHGHGGHDDHDDHDDHDHGGNSTLLSSLSSLNLH